VNSPSSLARADVGPHRLRNEGTVPTEGRLFSFLHGRADCILQGGPGFLEAFQISRPVNFAQLRLEGVLAGRSSKQLR